ncbi:MAG: mechanosensitive ion channel [Alphaproteobacteria bacterium]|nr:mechanosensitive ion channel [Alphaproteobacteria bacterium]
MFENIDIAKYAQQALEWFNTSVWTFNTLYQSFIIIGAFVIGNLIYRVIRPKILASIEKKNYPATIRRVSTNLVRQIYPLLTLGMIFISSNIAGSEIFKLNIGLSIGVMKVLLAWIVIRVAFQFISNSAVRNFFALMTWIIAALSILGWLNSTMTTLDSIAFTIGDFRLSALAVVKSLFLLFVLLYLAIFFSSFAERKIFQVKSLTRSSQVLLAKVIRVMLIVFALLIGITSAGIDLSLFAVFGGAIGLGIGFGLQKGISNLFSGMMLLLDKSIQPGDVIELENGTFGWVNQMAARYTEIVTRDNKSFLIPNEEFITQRVVNWSHGNSLIRLQVNFGVHYKSDPHQVIGLACETAAHADPRICKTPEPICHLTEFGDSSLNFSLRFWIKDAEAGITNIKGAVMLALWDMLKENNIEIPYPHREVYVHEVK